MLKTFANLTPSEFENFTFDVLSASGGRRLTWRTPGADGGRDIECEVFTRDFSGFDDRELWYVECKRYASTLDWPLVYGKIAHADANRADFLLIVTNSNPSPACETRIQQWNADRRRPRIRVWRGYELEGIATQFASVAAKYGLRAPPTPLVTEFLDLALEISKISQATYATVAVAGDAEPAVEASSALSELFSSRAKDLAEHGQFLPMPSSYPLQLYSWVECQAALVGNEIALRAAISTYRFITGSSGIRLSGQDGCYNAVAKNARIAINESALRLIATVGRWADLELTLTPEMALVIRLRRQERGNG